MKQPTIYTFALDEIELEQLGRFLGMHPFNEVAPLMGKLALQRDRQDELAAEATAALHRRAFDQENGNG